MPVFVLARLLPYVLCCVKHGSGDPAYTAARVGRDVALHEVFQILYRRGESSCQGSGNGGVHGTTGATPTVMSALADYNLT